MSGVWEDSPPVNTLPCSVLHVEPFLFSIVSAGRTALQKSYGSCLSYRNSCYGSCLSYRNSHSQHVVLDSESHNECIANMCRLSSRQDPVTKQFLLLKSIAWHPGMLLS